MYTYSLEFIRPLVVLNSNTAPPMSLTYVIKLFYIKLFTISLREGHVKYGIHSKLNTLHLKWTCPSLKPVT